MDRRIQILDTSLRDGNKLPFFYLDIKDRLEIARALSLLGVDIIDAGYPASSRDESESVALIAKEIKGSSVSALSRAIAEDIEETCSILSSAENPLLHIFLPIAPEFLERVLKKNTEKSLALIEFSIKLGKKAGIKVQFSLGEIGEAEEKFLLEAVRTACKAGADIINLADTNSSIYPAEAQQLIKRACQVASDFHETIIGVHFHNDLGLATANSLAAIEAGARHVEATICGLGPGGGNTPLEEVVFGLEAFRERMGFTHGIHLDYLDKTSALLSRLTGVSPHPNKPILGKCAFLEALGSQARNFCNPRFKDLMREETIGRTGDTLFGDQELSLAGFKQQLRAFDIDIEGLDIEKLYQMYSSHARRKKTVFLTEVLSMAEDTRLEEDFPFTLVSFNVMTGSRIHPVGIVELEKDGKKLIQSSSGSGPIDALCRAVDKAVGLNPRLVLYSVDSLTEGKDARAEVSVSLSYMGRRFHGHSGSTDVIEASVSSYLEAINRIELYRTTKIEESSYIDGESLWWE